MTEPIKEIAQSYLELSNGKDRDKEDIDPLEEEVEKWKNKLNDYDEDDPLHEDIKSKYEEAKEKLEQTRESQNRLEEIQEKLLKQISERFAPKGEWLDEKVIRAVNKVLIDRNKDTFYLLDKEVNSQYNGDIEEVIDIAERVRRLAKDSLKQTEEVEEFWEKFQKQKKFRPFEVLARSNEEMGRKEIANKIDDMDANTVGNNVRATIHTTDFNPYHRDGKYGLSLTGEYLKKKYMDIESAEIEEEKEGEAEENTEEENKSQQQKFFDTVSE
jgi:hypothetical protein